MIANASFCVPSRLDGFFDGWEFCPLCFPCLLTDSTSNMATWHYYNENREKFGPIEGKVLKQLAQQGIITPETFIEDPAGRTGLAKDVRGLTFPEGVPTSVSSSVIVPPTAESKAFTFHCPHCKSTLQAKERSAGKMKECPKCKESFTVPAAENPFTTPVPKASTPSPMDPIQDLLQRAGSNDIEAMRELSKRYMEGDGVEKNLAGVMDWMEKAALLGDAESQSNFAEMIRAIDGDSSEVFHWEQRAAEQGFPQAQHNLAVCFQDGLGTQKSLEKRFFWYQKAAENGYTESKRCLANCYVRGEGTSQDFERAIYWLKQASDEGDAEAKKGLGAAYIEGIGCAVDTEKGIALLRESAALGNEKAKELLNSDEVRNIMNGGKGTETPVRTAWWQSEFIVMSTYLIVIVFPLGIFAAHTGMNEQDMGMLAAFGGIIWGIIFVPHWRKTAWSICRFIGKMFVAFLWVCDILGIDIGVDNRQSSPSSSPPSSNVRSIPKRVKIGDKWYDVRSEADGSLNLSIDYDIKYRTKRYWDSLVFPRRHLVYDINGNQVGEFDFYYNSGINAYSCTYSGYVTDLEI